MGTNTTLAGTHIPGYYGTCPSSCPGAESFTCTPGTPYTVDCNTCVCGSDSKPVCTNNICGTTSTTTSATTTTSTLTTSTVTTSTTTTAATTTTAPSSTCITSSGP